MGDYKKYLVTIRIERVREVIAPNEEEALQVARDYFELGCSQEGESGSRAEYLYDCNEEGEEE